MKKVIVPHPNYLQPNNPKFICGLLAVIFVLILMFALNSCTSTKKAVDKKEQTTEQSSTSKIEYRTNTVYTDTGSITTYYRDSVIFRHDTAFQPIEKIINRWFKQELKHDTLTQIKHDTTTVTLVEKQTVKEKSAIPWFWIIVIGVVLAAGVYLFKGGFKI